jgi:hypothetical protein
MSAGRRAAPSLNADLVSFLEARGQNLADLSPTSLDDLTRHTLAEQYVIVSLEGQVSSYMTEIPFHTTALDWDLGPVPEAGDKEGIENLYRDISLHIKDLMETLRGEEAS